MGQVWARAEAPKVERISFVSHPARGDTYELGESIEVDVEFDRAVTVGGTPRLALTIGTRTRRATFFLRSEEYWGFFYTVRQEDQDADGISIAANALTLGGRPLPAADGAEEVDLTHPAVAASPDRKVDGSRVTAPRVRSVSYTHSPDPESGDTYGQGERIQVLVEFDRAVTVAGTPQIGLRIGLRKRQASYFPVDFVDLGSSVYFSYTVREEDRDRNGISIRARSLFLNGGAIRLAGEFATKAVLRHRRVGADPGRKVDGSRVAAFP